MTDQEQIVYYKNKIKEMLSRVPATVNAGSYDNAVAYKRHAAAACKLIKSARPNLMALISAHNQLAAYR